MSISLFLYIKQFSGVTSVTPVTAFKINRLQLLHACYNVLQPVTPHGSDLWTNLDHMDRIYEQIWTTWIGFITKLLMLTITSHIFCWGKNSDFLKTMVHICEVGLLQFWITSILEHLHFGLLPFWNTSISDFVHIFCWEKKSDFKETMDHSENVPTSKNVPIEPTKNGQHSENVPIEPTKNGQHSENVPIEPTKNGQIEQK